MTAAAAGRKQRTITLTDRQPVKIYEDEWPCIAEAAGDSWSGRDPSRYQQASHRGELDEYTLRVRRHADGRAIVYGVIDAATVWTGTQDWRGGELLTADMDIAAAIRRVGEDGAIPDKVIRECIAGLPAEEI